MLAKKEGCRIENAMETAAHDLSVAPLRKGMTVNAKG